MGWIYLKRFLRPFYVPVVERIRFAKIQHQYPIKIMSSTRTLRYIKEKNCSISRYGDGEFRIMLEQEDLGFQKSTELLADGLKKVILDSNEHLLVCFPKPIASTIGMKKTSASYWRNWCMNDDIRIRIYNYLSLCEKQNVVFGDAMLTRPYMDWKSKYRAKRIFKKIKLLWQDKNILIVEGVQTRLGIGNDLFAGAASIKRILAPAENAYDRYEEIKRITLQKYNNELVILALGPTATILAADLSKQGICTLDIGHLDIEYEWYLHRALKKEAIQGKYTNEVRDGRVFSDCDDMLYQRQIIARIGC